MLHEGRHITARSCLERIDVEVDELQSDVSVGDETDHVLAIVHDYRPDMVVLHGAR